MLSLIALLKLPLPFECDGYCYTSVVSEGKTSVRDQKFSVFAVIKDLGLLRKMGGGEGKKTRRSKVKEMLQVSHANKNTKKNPYQLYNCVCQLSLTTA